MFQIVYEHDDFVVLNKPEGISFHSEEGPGFVVMAEEQLGHKLYSVHRLDKVTSGLLVLAKSSQVAARLTEAFTSKEVQKFYLAISIRKPKKKQGWVKGDMAPSRRGSYKLLHTKNAPAITQFISTPLNEGERLFLLKPHTGKTHQLRVALKSLGSPIAGDVRYAMANEAKEEERTYLHAYAMVLPYDGAAFHFMCTPEATGRFSSEVFKQALVSWDTPWDLIS
jgi:tRNA pseudouridine32 synthase / 23S rRNA pseudouridine746 synthase